MEFGYHLAVAHRLSGKVYREALFHTAPASILDIKNAVVKAVTALPMTVVPVTKVNVLRDLSLRAASADQVIRELAQNATGDDFLDEEDRESEQINALYNKYGNKPKMSGVRPRDLSKVQCFNCKRMGHMKAQCRLNTAAKATTQSGQKRGGCYICEDPGHWADRCPQKKKGFWGNTGTNQPP